MIAIDKLQKKNKKIVMDEAKLQAYRKFAAERS